MGVLSACLSLGMADACTFQAGNAWYLHIGGWEWLVPVRLRLVMFGVCTFEAGNGWCLDV